MTRTHDQNIDKRQFSIITLLILTLCCIALSPSAAAHGVQRYDNGLWFDGSGFAKRTMWSVEGVFVAEAPDVEPDRVIDLEGLYIIPPFADAHHHDFGAPHRLDETVRKYLAAGILYVKNPNSIGALTDPVRETLIESPISVAWSRGGITSSGGHPTQIYDHVAQQIGWEASRMRNEAWFAADSEASLRKIWPEILSGRPDFIKVYLEHSEDHQTRRDDPAYIGTRGLDPALLALVVELAGDAGLPVTAHVTTAADFRTAVEAGVDEIAHLPLESLSEKDAIRAAERAVTVVTTTISHRPTTEVADVDSLHAENLARLRAAGARIVLGTDDGRLVTEEAENLVRLGVFNPAELLRIWTMETPQSIFPDRKIGHLEPGYEASFIGLGSDPLVDWSAVREVELVVSRGHRLEIQPDVTLPGIGDVVANMTVHRGVAAAVSEYRKLRETAGDRYDFSEAQLNAAGYALLRHGRIADAVTIFELNAEHFPDSFNVWDSLAEAVLAQGDRSRAVELYEKSLQMNPHNDNARQKLKEIGDDPPTQP